MPLFEEERLFHLYIWATLYKKEGHLDRTQTLFQTILFCLFERVLCTGARYATLFRNKQ